MKQNLLFNQASALGKRLAMVLTMLLTIGIGTMWGEDYELVSFSDIKTNDVIIIVGTKSGTAYAMTNTGTPPTPIKVTISNSKITSTATNITFTATNNGDNTITFVSTTSGTLYCTNDNNGVKIGPQTGNNTKFSFDSDVDRLKNIEQTRWLGIYNTQDWRCYTSASANNIKDTKTTFYRKVTAAPSHTITATSNNDSYGSVSLSGTTITATPKTGYRVSTSSPFSISPAGSATVTQNGNTFAVTPTANCTITINFEAIPTHQIIFNTGGLNAIAPISVAEGSTYNITQEPTGLTNECEYNTFIGWTEESSIAEASTKPTLVESITMGSSDITLYAVYSKTEGGNSTTTNTSSDVTLKDGVYNSSVSTITWTIADVITIKQETNGAQTAVSSSYISAPRWYAGHMITMTPLVNITSIVVTATSESYASDLQSSTYTNATASVSSTKVTITPTSGTLPITIVLGKQSRISSITVNYSTSSAGATTYSLVPECSTETLVSLDPNGGTGGTPSVTATKGEAMPTLITLPTRTGYTFQGYFTAASGGTQYYNADGTSAKDWDKTDETFTLYAQWECAAPTNVKITGEYIRFEGDDIVLTVSGDNIATDATYEWKKGDQVINNQTTATLTINNCTISDAGNYTCTVSNGICSASNNYTVKMYRLRGLTDPEDNWTTDFVFAKGENKTATYSTTLNGNSSYQFKVHDGSVYYGNTGANPTMTSNNCTGWTMQESMGNNVTLQTTITGTYIFTLDYTDESNPTISVTYPQKKMVYLNPGPWDVDDAKFAVHTWDGDNGEDIFMEKVDDCDPNRNIYQAEINASHTNIIFVRADPANSDIQQLWNYVLNQTSDLILPIDGKVMYDMTPLFLSPTAWNSDEAWFAAYFYGNGDTWRKMTDSDGNGIYECEKVSGYPNVIFCRMNPAQTALDWDSKWNQSGDLTIPTKVNNHYTVPSDNAWNSPGDDGNRSNTGMWTTYTPNHTVTFDANGQGTAPEDQCITDGEKAIQPTAPTATGYTFDGWYKEAGCTNAWDFANDVVTSNITLYAKWTANIHTLTWNVNGGNDLTGTYTSGSVAYGTVIIKPDDPTRTGHTFNGWSPAFEEGTTMPDDDLTYTAQWKFIPTLSWSAPSCTAALEADNDYPYLQTSPAELTGITYSSSDESVATIDANTGKITLFSVGETTITASFAGNGTYAPAADADYELIVVASNCRWVEVTDNTTLEDGDEVVITMTLLGTSYVLPNKEATNEVPEAIIITNTTSFVNDYIWIIGKNGNNLTFESYNYSGKFLTCNSSASDGVRVNNGANKTFVVDDIYGYLKNTTNNRYLGVHRDNIEWCSYALTDAGNFPLKIAGQTLKFYKRECLDSKHYWVTWDANEGTWTDGSSNKLESYQVGATITAPTENPTREGYRFDGWTPEPTTMPAQNTTFTAQWTEVYKITWYENGVPSYTYVPSDNPVVTWEDNIADCGEKKFYGWTTDDTFVSDPTTPPTLISKGTTIAGDVTYYAVYADAVEPANPGYTKVTIISEGIYLIATDETSDNKAYTGKYPDKAYGGTCDVTVNNQVIKTKPASAVEVEVTLGTGANSGKFAIYDGTYYLSAPDDNELTFNDNIVYDWKLTAEGYINSTGQSDRYIQLNSSANPKRFACYSSNQKKAYLYKKQTTTYANFAVSCATYDISVTTPTGGTVTTTPADEAGAGQTITVNVTPADCKYLTTLKYNDGSDHNINIASTPYTFTMPAADVTVTATFADKTATDIEILTSAHRNLMQGSAFVGEQIKVTYDNGETETLDWDDTRLTFSGYNMATLGTYTVRVDYNDCGTANTSYSIEVIDGIAITFIDAGISETIKYELNAHVDVETKTGQYACSGHEFVGWSETEFPLSDVPNMRTSEEYVPVRNFNATTSRTLYAVYSILKKQGWVSIEDANHIRSGAEYMIVKNRYGTYSALSTTTSTYNANYRAATILDKDGDDSTGNMIVWRRTSDNTDFQIYTGTATNDVKWLLIKKDNKNYLYNQTEKKYLQVTTTAITLTSEMADNFKITDESGDCCLNIQSATSNYYISGYNSSNNYYFQPYSTETDANYLLTRDSLFTTTPPCSPLYATFYGNGGIVTDGIKSGDYLTIKEPTRDAGITTPTASFADCNGKTWTFVGWAREEIDVTRIPVLTTDLLHDGGGNKHYNIEKNGEEFWAVYTNTGDPETKYGTITLTVADFDFNSYQTGRLTKEVLGDSYIIDYKDVGCPSGSGNGIQIAQMSEKNGYIMNTTSLGKINSIKFTNFEQGDIDDIRVYVGNTPDDITTLLTVEELQTVGDASTYYPNKNYSYFKIQSNKYTGIETISIDFGKGTQIWATTPDCSTITLSGDEIYVTATNGRAVMAPTTLTVKANQLEANADVILTSNSNDVYFSLDRSFNFAAGQAENQKPKTSLTLPTDAEGNLATTDVYIHYMPSSEGNGVPANVIISANLETPNPSITDDHTIHVRNLPAKFVIATKVGATWYALPADMTDDTNPLAEVIEVDEATMTATAPNTTTYTLWPVKTTNGTGNRYADYGDRLRFAAVNYEQRGLWANNNNNSSAIRNYAVINSLGADGTAAYEWKVTTTVVDGHWQYTLQTDQTQNKNYLRYWTSAEGTPVGPKWGTYNAGENKLYFLPVTETQPFEYDVVEWYPTKMLIQTDADIASPTVKVGGEKVESPELASKGGNLYEISNLPLETNPNNLLQVSFTADAVNYVNAKVVPIILSRGEKSITGEPFTTLTQKVYQYADVVVRDGATLTIDGGTDVANTLLGMTIYPTAKVAVAEGYKLSVHNLTFFGGIDEIYDGSAYTINKYGVPQLSLKGILNKTITNIDYIMRVNLDQMYQVGVPYDVNLSDITYWDGTAMELGEDLYISAYDGQARANRESKTWIWETDFAETLGSATLKPGIGYTISADKQDAAHEYSIIRMPMKNNITSGKTETAKTVQVYAYDNKNGVEITDNHKGWNYLSNPYMTSISGAESGGVDNNNIVVGYLVETGTGPWEWVNDEIRYVTIPYDDGTNYYQRKFSEATLLPFKSFFLQIANSGDLSFALASRQSAPARYLQSNNEQREVEFEVLLANDTRSDNLGFLIGEDYTPAYEINADLEKMIGSMSVYTIYNGYNLAYNALSPTNAAEQIPIGYVVPTVGEYTFALDESSDIEDVEHIYLIDYETSAITDLVTDVYTFTTLEQKSDTRFAINVALKSKDNTATGLDNMNTNSELPTKFIYQDKMYILHHGVIYDATGKRVITINK